MRKWTDEQKNAIDARGGSVVVSAAAGSGKTSVLVERVIQLITDEKSGVSVDRLLISTFSNAAANEMRERIEKRLNEKLRENPGSEFLQKQKLLLPAASISTMHAFCLNLLMENTEQLDFDSDFKLDDGARIDLIKQNAIDEVLEQAYAEQGKDFTALFRYFGDSQDNELKKTVLRIYDYIRSFPYPLRWLREKAAITMEENIDRCGWKDHLIRHACEKLKAAAIDFENYISLLKKNPPLSVLYLADFENIVFLLNDLADKLSKTSLWDSAYSAAVEFKLPSAPRITAKHLEQAGAAAEEKEYFKELRSKRIKKVNDMLSGIFCADSREFEREQKLLEPFYNGLFEIVERFYLKTEQLKKESALLDFTDLELYTVEVLSEKTEYGYKKSKTAELISARYDCIMLDEYQDTSPVQDRIFSLISNEESNLFIVGDIKQSIYGFRKADPDIFKKRKNDAALYDGVHFPCCIELNKNFRSRAEVTDIVNYIFGHVMSEQLGDVDYTGNELLYAQADFPDYDKAESELHLLLPNGDKNPNEAEYIARLINQMIENGYQVSGRPCTAGDFCIMTRSRAEVKSYVNELKKYDISSWSDSGEGFYDTREISVFISLLKVISNPASEIALTSVLMSPVYAFTADEIAQARACAPKARFYLAFSEYANHNGKARAFLDDISYLRSRSAVLPLGDLIREIYDYTDFPSVMGAMQSGENRRANLEQFLKTADAYESGAGYGLSGFLRFIDRSAENTQNVKGLNVVSDSENVVKIMTIHHSKGLEFPICILADTTRKFNMQDINSKVLCHSEYGIAAKVVDPDILACYDSPAHKASAVLKTEELLSEEMRLLYVALTRAKEKLIITASYNSEQKLRSVPFGICRSGKIDSASLKNAGNMACWIVAAAALHPDGEQLRKFTSRDFTDKAGSRFKILITNCEMNQKTEPTVKDRPVPDAEILKDINNNADYFYSHKEDTLCPAKTSVTELVKKSGLKSLKKSPDFLISTDSSGAERGNAFHKFMQVCDINSAVEDFDKEAVRLVEESFITPREYDIADKKQLKMFFGSCLAERMIKSEEFYREFPLIYEIPARELYPGVSSDETILVQGVADCVIIESDGAVILDYKTDKVGSEDVLKERYRKQLEMYRPAVEQAFGKKVKELIIYSSVLGKAILL